MFCPDRDRLVRQFMEFVQRDSPSGAEAPFVSALAGELEKLGLSVENDRSGENGAGNLLAIFPGTNRSLRPILLCMHTDTVEPGRGIRPRLEAGKIRSDGSTILGGDNKSAIAAALAGAQIRMANFRQTMPRMEEAFISLIGKIGEKEAA